MVVKFSFKKFIMMTCDNVLTQSSQKLEMFTQKSIKIWINTFI